MNQLILYAILDKKNGLFQPPFCEFSLVDAVRRFDSLLHRSDSVMSRYPDDFALYTLGTMALTSGEIESNISLICDSSDVANHL